MKNEAKSISKWPHPHKIKPTPITTPIKPHPSIVHGLFQILQPHVLDSGRSRGAPQKFFEFYKISFFV